MALAVAVACALVIYKVLGASLESGQNSTVQVKEEQPIPSDDESKNSPVSVGVGPPKHAQESHPSIFWWQSHEWWLVIFTGLLFLGTVALALYTAKLWRATVRLGADAKATAERQGREMQQSIAIAREAADAAKKSANTAESALISTQRALVFPSKIHAMAGISQKAGGAVVDWTFFIVWENAGSTPTRHMYMHTNWSSFNNELGEDFDFPDLSTAPIRRRPIVLGPKATTFSGESVIPIDVLIGAADKRNHVYLWGWVEYNDIFDKTARHRSEYSVEIIVPGDPKVPHFPGDPSSPNIPFFYRGGFKYSGMDDECFRKPMTNTI